MQFELADDQEELFKRLRNLTARRLRAAARGDWQLVSELGSLRHNCLQSLATTTAPSHGLRLTAA